MAGYVFLSYVRENAEVAERLATDLHRRGIEVWLDRQRLQPGERWRDAIRSAIRSGDLFLACFSEAFVVRVHSHMNEELNLALDELRSRPADRAWFVPVRIDGADIPEISISSRETIRDLQWVDLHADWQGGIQAIVHLLLSRTTNKSATIQSTNQTSGKPLRSASVADRLDRIDRAHTAADERRRFLDSEHGVHAAITERDALYELIAQRVASLSARAKTLKIEVETHAPTISTCAAGHSVVVSWTHTYSNTLDQSGLYLLEYEGSYCLSGALQLQVPHELRRTRFAFDVRDGIRGWSNDARFFTTHELANHCISVLLDYVEQVRK